MTTELMRTAYHEAGHAVAYIVHRRTFRYVTLRPRNRGHSGSVVVRPRKIDPGVSAVIAHAGPIAEGIHTASTLDLDAEGLTIEDVIGGAYLAGGSGDLAAIKEAMTLLGVHPADPMQPIARQIVEREWSAITRVAERLAVARTLSYRAVLDLSAVTQ